VAKQHLTSLAKHATPSLFGAALGLFLLSIAYSVVLHQHIVNADTAELISASIGTQVIVQYTLASAMMLLVWKLTPQQPNKQTIAWILIAGTLARLILLAVEPYTSNDVLRYLFDGRIALAGFDPYRMAHDAPQLAELRAAWTPPAEHAKYPTLYPPLALSLFSLVASTGVNYAAQAWAVLTTVASLSVLWIGYIVLQHARKLEHLALLALSPILIIEAGEGNHVDVFSALFLMLAVYCWQRQKLVLVGAMLALGGIIKILPLLLLLPLVIMLPHWRDKRRLIISTLSIWLSAYGLFFCLGLRPIGSLAIFFEKWRSGSPLFLWLEPSLQPSTLVAFIVVLMMSSMLMISVYTWFNQRKSPTLWLSAQWAMATPLLLSPVVFPWYLMSIAVLISLRPSVFMLTWTISLPLIYEVLNDYICCQHWAPADWPVHAIGLSLILAAVADLMLNKSNIKRYQFFCAKHIN